MLDLELEEQRLERLRWQSLGESWIRAVSAGVLDLVGECCWPDASSVLLTPKRAISHQDAAGLVSQFYQWFGECTRYNLLKSGVGRVGERLSLFYRLEVEEHGAWFTVEQQVFATLEGGRIAQLQLLCSGFQPVLPGR